MNGRHPGLPALKTERFHPAPNIGSRALRRQLAAEARGKVRASNLSFRDMMAARVRERREQETQS